MIANPLRSLIAKLVVGLLGMALVLAPVASAQHGGAIAGADCSYEHVLEADEGEDHASHANGHTNGCGGCHAHMLACEPADGSGTYSCPKLVPARFSDPLNSRPDGLFRPPRA